MNNLSEEYGWNVWNERRWPIYKFGVRNCAVLFNTYTCECITLRRKYTSMLFWVCEINMHFVRSNYPRATSIWVEIISKTQFYTFALWALVLFHRYVIYKTWFTTASSAITKSNSSNYKPMLKLMYYCNEYFKNSVSNENITWAPSIIFFKYSFHW